MKPITIIAEAGVNHNGDLGLALDLVAAAAEAGADYVKFQTFDAGTLASRTAPLADYQIAAGVKAASQQAMLAGLQLDAAAHERLIEACQAHVIGFLSSAFDHASLELLTGRLGLDRVKFGSGELTNAPLLLAAAHKGARLILSTGMANLGEIEQALGVIAYGLLERAGGSPGNGTGPGLESFAAAWYSSEGAALVRDNIVLMHCVSDYPADDGDLNLRAIDTIQKAFDVPTGYSDHSLGSRAALAAAARGIECLEKHLTLDRRLPGPDHTASLEPEEMSTMVSDIRAIEVMLGSGRKVPAASEAATAQVARKTIVAARDIAAGECFSEDDLAIRRAGKGLSPVHFWSMLGRPARRAFRAEEIIEL